MSGQWLKWFGSDWLSDPAVRMSSYEARGLWMDMLCLMMNAEPCGSLVVNGRQLTAKQLAMLTGGSAQQVSELLEELEANGVFSRDPDGTIFSRRMRRDAAKAAVDRANGKGGGNPNLIGRVKPPPTGGLTPPPGPGVNGGEKTPRVQSPGLRKESSSKDARAGAEGDDDEVLIRKVEGALAGKASLLVVRKGLPIVRGWIAEGCDLALHVLPELSEIGRNLKTPLRTLDSAKWAAQVRARRDAELHEPPTARPPPTNVLVRVDSPESKAWLAYLHKKSFPLNRAGTGFYQPSRWPPGYEPASAAEALH